MCENGAKLVTGKPLRAFLLRKNLLVDVWVTKVQETWICMLSRTGGFKCPLLCSHSQSPAF